MSNVWHSYDILTLVWVRSDRRLFSYRKKKLWLLPSVALYSVTQKYKWNECIFVRSEILFQYNKHFNTILKSNFTKTNLTFKNIRLTKYYVWNIIYATESQLSYYLLLNMLLRPNLRLRFTLPRYVPRPRLKVKTQVQSC